MLDASGQPAKFLLREMYTASGSVRWDLRTGEVAEIDNPPPALAYRWGSGGELTPSDTLSTVTPAHAISSGPIGDPAGGGAVSVWQPARITLTRPPGHASTGYGAYTSATMFSAPSPGGRYLIPDVYLYGRFEPDGRAKLDKADLNELLGFDAPVIPVRDAALHQALLDIPMSAISTQEYRYSTASIAWRPDGRLLAMAAPYCYTECAHGSVSVTRTPASGNETTAGAYARRFIRLYQSDSGRVAFDLTPRNGEAEGSLSWSPDGTRFMLLRKADAITWNVGALR